MLDSLSCPIRVSLSPSDAEDATEHSGMLLISDEVKKTLIDKIIISENAEDAFLYLRKYLSEHYTGLTSISPTCFAVTLKPQQPRSTGCSIPPHFRNTIVRTELRSAIRDYMSERNVLRSSLERV